MNRAWRSLAELSSSTLMSPAALVRRLTCPSRATISCTFDMIFSNTRSHGAGVRPLSNTAVERCAITSVSVSEDRSLALKPYAQVADVFLALAHATGERLQM
jgi:hypothetical protein